MVSLVCFSGLSGLSGKESRIDQRNQMNQRDRSIWLISFISFVLLAGSANLLGEPQHQRNESSALAGRSYTYFLCRWLSGQEKGISEPGTEEEQQNSLAKVHPKSGHRGRDRHHLATRSSLIRL